MISDRAEKLGVLVAPPHFPASLLRLIQIEDPVNAKYESTDPFENPFLGKRILVLAGGKDKLVPWSASEIFVKGLNVGHDGAKKVVVVPEAGHECPPVMVQELIEFIWEWA